MGLEIEVKYRAISSSEFRISLYATSRGEKARIFYRETVRMYDLGRIALKDVEPCPPLCQCVSLTSGMTSEMICSFPTAKEAIKWVDDIKQEIQRQIDRYIQILVEMCKLQNQLPADDTISFDCPESIPSNIKR